MTFFFQKGVTYQDMKRPGQYNFYGKTAQNRAHKVSGRMRAFVFPAQHKKGMKAAEINFIYL
jgi:hypothetical protein